jgi:hypothetical protein
VATFLGLEHVYFSRIILESKSKFLVVLNLIIVSTSVIGNGYFRGGGMITGF